MQILLSISLPLLIHLSLHFFITLSTHTRATSIEERVSSKLNFDSHNESTWGRLYLQGFPGHNGMQYFRAHFGSEPPLHHVKFVLANPSTYCRDNDEEERSVGKSNDLSPSTFDVDTILVVKRGDCTFVEKSQRAKDVGAGGLLIVNNEVRSKE